MQKYGVTDLVHTQWQVSTEFILLNSTDNSFSMDSPAVSLSTETSLKFNGILNKDSPHLLLVVIYDKKWSNKGIAQDCVT